MTTVNIGDNEIPTDVRTWDASLRRNASLIVLAAAGAFLLVGVLFYLLAPAASAWYLTAAIVVLALLLVAEAAIVATGIASEENIGPPWLAGQTATMAGQTTTTGAPPGQQPEPTPRQAREPVHIDLKCPECAEIFTTEDTGERPLHTRCPHCQAEGHVDLEPPEHATPAPKPARGEPASEQATQEVETLALKCPACETQFEVDDDGTRPLRATCPGCGRGGKLKG